MIITVKRTPNWWWYWLIAYGFSLFYKKECAVYLIFLAWKEKIPQQKEGLKRVVVKKVKCKELWRHGWWWDKLNCICKAVSGPLPRDLVGAAHAEILFVPWNPTKICNLFVFRVLKFHLDLTVLPFPVQQSSI